MKQIIYGALLLSFTVSAYAFDEKDASELVRKYSNTVACAISSSDEAADQYKAIKLDPGHPDLGGMGMVFVVHWVGGFGCPGGNRGGAWSNFTIVEHRGYSAADPIVVTDYEFPEVPLAYLTSFSSDNGDAIIEGMVYGENDPNISPSKHVAYRLKYVDYTKFTIEIIK